jgi:hypothetical protein
MTNGHAYYASFGQLTRFKNLIPGVVGGWVRGRRVWGHVASNHNYWLTIPIRLLDQADYLIRPAICQVSNGHAVDEPAVAMP